MTDRELDAAIAKHVMGIVWDETRCRVCGWLLAGNVEQGCTDGSCSMRPAPNKRADTPVPYSTEIGAAWLVVERVTRIPESDEEAARAANTRFALWFERTSLWAMTAREAAHAICMGALEAVGVSL